MKKLYYTIVQESFKEIDLNNKFFNSFKRYYEEFETWFKSKQDADETAFVINTPYNGILAFGYFKSECEEIKLNNKILPAQNRLKIGSLKVDTRMAGEHLYHTFIKDYAINLATAINADSIYVTTYPNNIILIKILEEYGFIDIGTIESGELLFILNLPSKSKLMFPDVWVDKE